MDFNIIEGTYGVPGVKSDIKFPAVGGNEGVGTVLEVGSSVKGIQVNDRVIPAKSGLGTWRTHGVFESNDLQTVNKDIPTEYAGSLSVNPATAYRLLKDFVDLKPGDVVIQNASTGMVGQAVTQLARQMGIKTINIIRSDKPDFDQMVMKTQELGGYLAVSDKYMLTAPFRRLLSDLPPPKLALNGAGGDSATEMLRILGNGGTMVTYGAMSRKPFTIPASHLIFKQLSLKGFWLSEWYKTHSAEERQKMFNDLSNSIKQGHLKLNMEKFKFDQFESALAKTNDDSRKRKVILDME